MNLEVCNSARSDWIESVGGVSRGGGGWGAHSAAASQLGCKFIPLFLDLQQKPLLGSLSYAQTLTGLQGHHLSPAPQVQGMPPPSVPGQALPTAL